MSALSREEFLADLSATLQTCAHIERLVAVVRNGFVLACNVNRMGELPADISGEDFVLGMEALGLPVHLLRQPNGDTYLSTSLRHFDLPKAWQDRAAVLAKAFPPQRMPEVAAYLESVGRMIDCGPSNGEVAT